MTLANSVALGTGSAATATTSYTTANAIVSGKTSQDQMWRTNISVNGPPWADKRVIAPSRNRVGSMAIEVSGAGSAALVWAQAGARTVRAFQLPTLCEWDDADMG